MKKIFPLFLLLATICIVWSCTTKKRISPRNYKPKVEDYECIVQLHNKRFYLNDTILVWKESDKHATTLAEYSVGDSIFEEYCNNTLIYPWWLAENMKVGYVRIIFGVKEDGNIDSVRVGSGFFPTADSVALEVVKNQPPKMWIPAHREDGSFVYSEVIMNFNFRLKK